jgi:hypothetical protein
MMRTRNLTLDAVIGRLLSSHTAVEERVERPSHPESMALYDAVVVSPHREAARSSPVCLAFKESSGY